jgi:predicted nucleotidyltransferase
MRRWNARGKPIDIEPYREDLQKYLESQESLVAAWLYGSYGTPFQTPLSDLDLAVLYRRDRLPGLPEQGGVYTDLAALLHEEDLSITVLNRSPVLFQFRVLETGRLLVCRDPIALADFIESVISRHADFIVDHERFVHEYDEALVEQYGHDG